MQTVEEPSRIGLPPEAAEAKHNGQKERILKMLQAAGARGCTSEELNRVAFRYASSLHRLRRDGWQIETVGRKDTELARYIYKGNAFNVEDNGQLIIPGA